MGLTKPVGKSWVFPTGSLGSIRSILLLFEPGRRIAEFWPFEGARGTVLLARARHRSRACRRENDASSLNWDDLPEIRMGKNGTWMHQLSSIYLYIYTIHILLSILPSLPVSQIERHEHQTWVCFVKNQYCGFTIECDFMWSFLVSDRRPLVHQCCFVCQVCCLEHIELADIPKLASEFPHFVGEWPDAQKSYFWLCWIHFSIVCEVHMSVLSQWFTTNLWCVLLLWFNLAMENHHSEQVNHPTMGHGFHSYVELPEGGVFTISNGG